MKKQRKILVAGSFDLLHSGHVRFLEEAASFGRVTCVVGSDENLYLNKGKRPIFNQLERAYMLQSLKYVEKVITPEDTTPLNFAEHLDGHDMFIINNDGHTAEKESICKKHSVEYLVLERKPQPTLRAHSSTDLRSKINLIPQRLDIVGFYDQKVLNTVYPGSVILANIVPFEADDRSGMSSSTTGIIEKLFGPALPSHLTPMEIAKAVFAVENPPDRKYISGVVDQLGICLPGINKLNFNDEYFPNKIQSVEDKSIITWLSKHLYLVQTKPRPDSYSVFDGRESFQEKKVMRHSELGEMVWQAILDKDINNFGHLINAVHESQKDMIPGYESEQVKPIIQKAQARYLGAKLMGAGGFGYVMVVSSEPVENGISVEITLP